VAIRRVEDHREKGAKIRIEVLDLNFMGAERVVRPKRGESALDETQPEVERWQATIEQAAALPIPEGQRSVEVLSHGTMVVKYYAPCGTDEQTPHTRDELYVVARGSGAFVYGDSRHPFSAGDVLFVPAGKPHRFEDFTDDFGTWVIFYGPEGDERPH
jgi:mannose-6-phosphate isomerase-like protein (cupin superfamily)